MNAIAWFLSEAAVPVSLGAVLALAVDVARTSPTRVRHYRWRNRRFLRQVRALELRSRTPGGSGSAGSLPLALPAPAGGDARTPRPVAAALPPAPCPLVGAALIPSSAAPARPPRVMVHG